jgi:hypothetical protein
MALALQAYEDGLCSGCGHPMSETMDPDLLDEWDYLTPHRCGACTQIAKSRDVAQKTWDQPEALRHIPALPEGWQERRESARRRRAEDAASGQPDHE